jgi:hypothetical protein
MPATDHLLLPCLRSAWRAAAFCALLVLCPWAGAQAPFDPAQAARERARIHAERERLEAAFAIEEARCAERFAVTACLDDVRLRRRGALARPRAQALAIDDAERQARAEARRAAVDEKRRRAAARPPIPSEPARAPRELPPAPPVVLTEPAPRPSSAPAEAARRVEAARERQADIRATQQRIEARQAERARQRKPSAPLPVPSAASSGRR